MKKIPLFALCLLLITGCTHFGEIKVMKDEFKNVNVITMELLNMSERTDKGARAMFSTFTRLIDAKNNEQFKISLKVRLFSIDSNLTETVFFKIDDRKYDLKLGSMNAASKTMTHTSGNKTTTSNWEEHSGQFELNKKIRQDLRNCSSLMIRVYAGELPYDYKFSAGDLKKIKELLTYEINGKK